MPKFQTQKIPTSYRVHRRHLNLKQAQSISLREETNIPIRFVKNQLLFTPFSRHFSTRPRRSIMTANSIYFGAGLLFRIPEYVIISGTISPPSLALGLSPSIHFYFSRLLRFRFSRLISNTCPRSKHI